MRVIEWHDMTMREYNDATVTSVIGGSTWLRMPKVFGDDTIWFVVPVLTPQDIIRQFARDPNERIRVQIYTGVLPDHA